LITLERKPYAGWQNCWQLSNGRVSLLVTGDVGPRILRFGFEGGENELLEIPTELGLTGGDAWRMYGGHRLWRAPEDRLLTYLPDNAPVTVEALPDGLWVIQQGNLQKEMEIHLADETARVRIVHRLRNRMDEPLELAVWALTVLAPGGTAILPLPPRGEHPRDLLPNQALVMWSYTDLGDPLWRWGREHVLLVQPEMKSTPHKLGGSIPGTWLGYARAGRLFFKRVLHPQPGNYPDLGSAVELFACRTFVELETLGPLVTLQPGQAVEHVEEWRLVEDVPQPLTEADVLRDVTPIVERWLT
jgi:hypothetical protein